MPTQPPEHAGAKPDGVEPLPVLGYGPPKQIPPVTRGERGFVLIGYFLLVLGSGALVYAFQGEQLWKQEITKGGVIAFLAGAAITVGCFTYNALRRM